MRKIVRIERSQRKRASYRSNYHLLVVFGSGVVGAALGFAIGRIGADVYPFNLAILLPFIGFVAGVFFGIGIESLLDQARRQDYKRWNNNNTANENDESELMPLQVDVEPNPRSFRQRLAQFTDKKENEVLEEENNNQSKMPYWSAEETLNKVPPHSASWIRAILMRIRSVLYDN
ncbi:MAG: F0F1-type ATP synthase assembly protein I [Pirellulaceae bacterium]|jgi:F0F1-type ATP synthase assembly protein I